MGPYCKFCGRRCFVPLPEGTPKEHADKYRPAVSVIIATCAAGQAFEKAKYGTCYGDIIAAVA